MSGQNLPVSAILRQGQGIAEEVEDRRRTKDEYRKQKALLIKSVNVCSDTQTLY